MNQQQLNKHLLDRVERLEKVVFDKASSGKTASSKKSEVASASLVIGIINKITDCELSEQIEKQVLDKNSQDNRIILPYYISYKYFDNQRLKTSDIEKITQHLGVKVKASNIGTRIKGSLYRYLEADSERKKGRPSFYKLNRRGVRFFENIVKS